MKKIVMLLSMLLFVADLSFASMQHVETISTANLPNVNMGSLEVGKTYSATALVSGVDEFTHNYTFTVGAPFSFGLGLSNNEITLTNPYVSVVLYDLASYSAELWDAAGRIASGMSFVTNTLTASTTYTLKIIGDPNGLVGGSYTFGATVNPVPVPGAVLLFGSGLLGLVGLRRRQIV